MGKGQREGGRRASKILRKLGRGESVKPLVVVGLRKDCPAGLRCVKVFALL